MSTERDLNEALVGGSSLNVGLHAVPHWWTCKTHGDAMPNNAWGCPECVREMRSLRNGLLDMIQSGRLTEDVIPDDWQWLMKILTPNAELRRAADEL